MVFEWPLVGLLVAAVLYGLGRRSRDNVRRDACFYGGLVVIAAAIDSPIDEYADRLFWAHLVQHVLLTMVAPPLILLGRPWPRSVRALPVGARRVIARSLHACRGLAAPLVAFALFNGVLLAWHVPALFDLTLRNAAVHDLEHAL
ncbi:MAG: cytochrome c oxidase assembly protein, partial [Gaiellaceae bacterium]